MAHIFAAAALGIFILACASVTAAPLLQTFSSCLPQTGLAPSDQLLNFTQLWTQLDTEQTAPGTLGNQVDEGGQKKDVLRMTLVGTTGVESEGYSSDTNYLATLITTASVLNFQAYSNQSALCSSIRDPNFMGNGSTTGNTSSTNLSDATSPGCPYGPGDIALGVSIPLAHSYPLTTISTQLRILDTSTPALVLGCVDIETTPYYPSHYFYSLVLWIPIGLTLAFFVVTWLGRLWAAHISTQIEFETRLAISLTHPLSSPHASFVRVGNLWWHAWSGQGLMISGALLRFATPSARELLWHTQFVASLGMIGVSWPGFAYPVLARGAWSTLIYNVSLTQSDEVTYDPLITPAYDPPSEYSAQFSNTASPLYLNADLPNVLFNFGDHKQGMDSWAATVGLRSEDLFGTCLGFFFVICAGVVALSVLWYFLDALSLVVRKLQADRLGGAMENGEEVADGDDGVGFLRMNGAVVGEQRGVLPGAAQAPWWQLGRRLTMGKSEVRKKRRGEKKGSGLRRGEKGWYHGPEFQYHWALLQGNLVRILLLFYYPIVIFSVFQLSLGPSASIASLALASVSLLVVTLVIPILQFLRLRRQRSEALVGDRRVTLVHGPLCNTFAEGSEGFMGLKLACAFVSGIVVGAAQKQGIAQAVVILSVEIVETLFTSLWLPWGDGAAMGPLAFVLSVTRIITAVLLVVLSPTVGVSTTAAGWLTYIIIILQGIVYLLAFFVVTVKLVELLLRVIAHIPFEETRSTRSGGLSGAIQRWDRGGGRSQRHGRAAQIAARRRRRGSKSAHSQMSSSHRSTSRPSIMLDLKQGDPSKSITGGASSMGSRQELYNQLPLPFTSDDGFIMSAMSQGPWLRATPVNDFGQAEYGQEGYVAPGAYSARSPNKHRLSLSWGDQQPSGFSVVRGGRATEKAPWQMDNDGRNGQTSLGNEYPPYGHQMSSSASMGRPRSHSLSASVELVSDEWGGVPLTPSRSRPGTTTNLFASASGTAAAAATIDNEARENKPQKKAKKSVFGMFGLSANKRNSAITDVSSDEDDDDDDPGDEQPKKSQWLLGLLGRKSKPACEETKPPATDTGFEVVRKPRPRPAPSAGNGATKPLGISPPTFDDPVVAGAGASASAQIWKEESEERDLTLPVTGSSSGFPAGAAPPSLPGFRSLIQPRGPHVAVEPPTPSRTPPQSQSDADEFYDARV